MLTILNEKRDGYYVELGSGHYMEGNNTYLLETGFGWRGLAIDVDAELAAEYNSNRKNECVAVDALAFNYKKYFQEHNFPKVIDYLQIDIDNQDSGSPLLALLALPLLEYRFRVITFEHDVISNYKWAQQRDAQREILYYLGYRLTGHLDEEDWWLDPLNIARQEGEEDPFRNYTASPYISTQVP